MMAGAAAAILQSQGDKSKTKASTLRFVAWKDAKRQGPTGHCFTTEITLGQPNHWIS